MEQAAGRRRIEIVTAVLLGLVSVITALGAWQASTWNAEAKLLSLDAADARDQGITIGVTAQLRGRGDLRAVLESRLLAQRQDAALAAGDQLLALELQNDIAQELGRTQLEPALFEAWRAAGFPDDDNPVLTAEYAVEQGRVDADALAITSRVLSAEASALSARAGIFGQAALVHALALFLFGVAGINRLRLARYVTLFAGAGVFLFGLFLMTTAY